MSARSISLSPLGGGLWPFDEDQQPISPLVSTGSWQPRTRAKLGICCSWEGRSPVEKEVGNQNTGEKEAWEGPKRRHPSDCQLSLSPGASRTYLIPILCLSGWLGDSGWPSGSWAGSPEDQPELGVIATGTLRSLKNAVGEALE